MASVDHSQGQRNKTSPDRSYAQQYDPFYKSGILFLYTCDTVVVMNINLSNLIIGLLTTSIVFTSPVSAVVIHASHGE